MTAMEAAAWVVSDVLVKGSLVGVTVMLAARCARSAASARRFLGVGFGALAVSIMFGPFAPSPGSGFVSVPHEAVQNVSLGPWSVSPAVVLVTIWAAGAVLLLSRLGHDLRAAWDIAGRAERGWPRGDRPLHSAARAIGCTRVPEIRETSELATAALIGFRRPILLIPTQARAWSDEELFGVLCHELEHCRRHDWLMLVLERIVGAIFWINPLVHVMTRQAAAAREMAADDAAMRAGAGATAYARRLIEAARDIRTAPTMAVSVAFASCGIDRRVKALFDPGIRRPSSRSSTLVAFLIAVPLVLTMAAVEPFVCLPGPATGTEACP